MNSRDFDYIETRLLAPCQAALEAHGRLVQVSEYELGKQLMEAMQVFVDECRKIRQTLPR